ncbi:response regulator transcription factor [Sphaerotilus sp.]|uniref:response regulator transcription factor n=1 Tax=Sphaerotilus sp. TaxID=2093942 RepID=UPI002ACEBD17|nr:response regulator [Sphaerotilus sp.]MDZ7858897.1 response regulator [Sphaerotilus sp.]
MCVVDDDAMVRTSLQMLLEVLGMRVSTYADAAAFLADPLAPDCDVLLLDVRMPGMSGLQLQAQLNERHADVPILFISGHGDIPMAVRAMRAGALDFLQKPFNEQVLIDWIQTAIQRRESARDRADGADEVRRRLASLTPREREVLDAVMEGKANKVIAADFGVSLKTVEQHRSRMMGKLGVRKVADIFRLLQGADPPDAGGALLG